MQLNSLIAVSNPKSSPTDTEMEDFYENNLKKNMILGRNSID